MAHDRPAWVGLEDAPLVARGATSGAVVDMHGDGGSVNDHLRRELAARGGESTTLRITGAAAASVDAYIEYKRIVGNADGGVMFTDEEYARFRAAAVAERGATRLYVAWRNGAGVDCKGVGPATQCECGHRYKEHATDKLTGQRHAKDMRCREPKCRCLGYTYLPSAGAWNAKCACKHGSTMHDPRTRACSAPRCACACFAATFSCGCGEGWATHTTVVETRDERVASGRPVDNLLGGGAGFEAMGGITNFASLTDGYDSASQGLAAVEEPPQAQAALAGRLAAARVTAGAAAQPLAHAATAATAASSGGGDALAKLKAARAAARSRPTSSEAAVSPAAAAAALQATARPLPASAPAPAPPAAAAAAAASSAQTYAAKKRAAAEHAASLAAERRAAAAAKEAEEIAKLPELEQLHRLSLRR